MPVRVSPVAKSRFELRPRQPEVEQFNAVRSDEDVGRLQIAVNDAALMQRGQRTQHSESDRQRLGHAQRAAAQLFGERLALEQLHCNEQLALVLPYLVNLADVGMVDARGRPGFAPETLPRRLVARERRHRLDGDAAVEAFVARGVDDTHSAFSELPLDDVVPDPIGQNLAGLRRAAGKRRCGRRRAKQPISECTDHSWLRTRGTTSRP